MAEDHRGKARSLAEIGARLNRLFILRRAQTIIDPFVRFMIRARVKARAYRATPRDRETILATSTVNGHRGGASAGTFGKSASEPPECCHTMAAGPARQEFSLSTDKLSSATYGPRRRVQPSTPSSRGGDVLAHLHHGCPELAFFPGRGGRARTPRAPNPE